MPDTRTEPVLCDHRLAPWIPLCEHAGQIRAGELSEEHLGRVLTTSEGTGVLTGLRHLDDTLTQLLLSPGRPDDAIVTQTPAGEIVRYGFPPPRGDG